MNFGLVNNACRSAPTRFPRSSVVRYSVLLAAVLDIESNDGEGLTDYTFDIRTIEQPLKLLNCFGGLGNVHMDFLGRMMGWRRGGSKFGSNRHDQTHRRFNVQFIRLKRRLNADALGTSHAFIGAFNQRNELHWRRRRRRRRRCIVVIWSCYGAIRLDND